VKVKILRQSLSLKLFLMPLQELRPLLLLLMHVHIVELPTLLHQPLHKTIKLLAGALVEVVEEGEDVVEGEGEQAQDDFVLGRGAVL
jgi:hypothetical protein